MINAIKKITKYLGSICKIEPIRKTSKIKPARILKIGLSFILSFVFLFPSQVYVNAQLTTKKVIHDKADQDFEDLFKVYKNMNSKLGTTINKHALTGKYRISSLPVPTKEKDYVDRTTNLNKAIKHMEEEIKKFYKEYTDLHQKYEQKVDEFSNKHATLDDDQAAKKLKEDAKSHRGLGYCKEVLNKTKPSKLTITNIKNLTVPKIQKIIDQKKIYEEYIELLEKALKKKPYEPARGDCRMLDELEKIDGKHGKNTQKAIEDAIKNAEGLCEKDAKPGKTYNDVCEGEHRDNFKKVGIPGQDEVKEFQEYYNKLPKCKTECKPGEEKECREIETGPKYTGGTAKCNDDGEWDTEKCEIDIIIPRQKGFQVSRYLQTDGQKNVQGNIFTFLGHLIDFAISFVGSASGLAVLIGAVIYIVAQGNDGLTGKAKDAITYGIIGLIVAVTAYIVVHFVVSVFYLGG